MPQTFGTTFCSEQSCLPRPALFNMIAVKEYINARPTSFRNSIKFTKHHHWRLYRPHQFLPCRQRYHLIVICTKRKVSTYHSNEAIKNFSQHILAIGLHNVTGEPNCGVLPLSYKALDHTLSRTILINANHKRFGALHSLCTHLAVSCHQGKSSNRKWFLRPCHACIDV